MFSRLLSIMPTKWNIVDYLVRLVLSLIWMCLYFRCFLACYLSRILHDKLFPHAFGVIERFHLYKTMNIWKLLNLDHELLFS